MQKPHRRGSTGWQHLLRFFVALSNIGWFRLIAKVTSSVLVALAFLTIMLIIGFHHVDLQVKDDGIYLGSIKIARVITDTNYKELNTQVTVMATAGFQNSGIYLHEGDKVNLEADGRIHLAFRQVYTFFGRVKPLIGEYLSPQPGKYKQYKVNYPLQPFTKEDVFRRDWLSPDGEEISSNDLNECLLFQGNTQEKGRWGQLLAVVMQKPGSATADPFQVLENNKLNTKDLIPYPSLKEIVAPRSGWLTFIINDAVISKQSLLKSIDCKNYFVALEEASKELKQQGQIDRIINPLSIPLVWYSDNIGAFNVIVRYVQMSTQGISSGLS